MAKLIINKTTNDKSGGSISANAIIGFDTIFKWGTLEIHYNLVTYRSQTDYDNGKSKIYINEIPSYGIVKTMTTQEYSDLLSNGSLAVDWLKTALISTGNFIDADLTISA